MRFLFGAVILLLLGSPSLAASPQTPFINQQPGAPDPLPSQHRKLDWGSLNFIHTTDVHGWVEGHMKEPFYSADWGDVYSFIYHMKRQAQLEGRDLLVVDTGDHHDGTGLSDTTNPDGKITEEIFKYVDYDLLTVGNHELYVGAVTRDVYKNFIPRYKGRYLTSNVNITVNGVSRPMGDLYRKFRTPINNYTILAFGILFDFTGNDKFVSTCQPVDKLVNETWFQTVLREETSDVDLIVVTGHTPIRNTTGFEYDLVLAAIRQHLPSMPVQFFGGHSHIRDFRRYDEYAYGIESGRYLETLGWINLDFKPFKAGRRYIDNNVESYQFHVSIGTQQEFETQQGKAISDLIKQKRDEQGLDVLLGCVPQNYYMNRVPYPSSNNIYSLLTDEVFPKLIYNSSYNRHRLILLNTGGIRFDLLKGNFTLDDEKIVSPFQNAFFVLKDILYGDARIVLDWLNTGRFGYFSLDHDCSCGKAWPGSVQKSWQRAESKISSPKASVGYVTYDDFGSDGDDTVHTPVPYYDLPYFIQSTIIPDNIRDSDFVDLIFTNFSSPAIIDILNTYAPSGRTHDLDELEPYQSDPITMTNVFERYVQIEPSWQTPKNGTCD